MRLPGVARKTANVLRATAYGLPGIIVDTHFIRLLGRMGLTANDKPEKIEADLCALLPEDRWSAFSHAMLFHGRAVCEARKPACDRCCVKDLCPSAFKFPHFARGQTMKLKWAFNSASVMNLGWDDEFKLWKKFKWRAVELWFDKVKACMEQGRTCAELGGQMYDAGITPIGVGPAAVWTIASGHHPGQERHELLERMDVTLALGAPMLTLVILGRAGGDLAGEYHRLADKLRGVAEMAAGRRLQLALEFIGGYEVNGTLGSAIDLVRKA